MVSKGDRLSTDKADPTKNLGSPWRPEHDHRHWRRGVSISKAEYCRPPYLAAAAAAAK
jgi:hypothetical protein